MNMLMFIIAIVVVLAVLDIEFKISILAPIKAWLQKTTQSNVESVAKVETPVVEAPVVQQQETPQ